jgi:hypothetical protein
MFLWSYLMMLDPDYKASNGRMADEVDRIWKEDNVLALALTD